MTKYVKKTHLKVSHASSSRLPDLLINGILRVSTILLIQKHRAVMTLLQTPSELHSTDSTDIKPSPLRK